MRATANLSPEPEVTPVAQFPTVTNADDVRWELEKAYTRYLQSKGCGGTTRFWVRVLSDGTVDTIRLHSSSGLSEIDDAARRLADATEFAPATDGMGGPVSAWIVVPITMRMGR